MKYISSRDNKFKNLYEQVKALSTSPIAYARIVMNVYCEDDFTIDLPKVHTDADLLAFEANLKLFVHEACSYDLAYRLSGHYHRLEKACVVFEDGGWITLTSDDYDTGLAHYKMPTESEVFA